MTPGKNDKDSSQLYKISESVKDRIRISSIVDGVIFKLQVYLEEIKSLNVEHGEIQLETRFENRVRLIYIGI